MKPSVQHKINTLKALAKGSAASPIAKNSPRMVNDNLSKSIRSEKDAKVFKKELNTAFKLAKE